MQETLINIVKNYSLEDLNSVRSILEQIHNDRLKDLELSPSLERFSKEYLEYIKNNYSSSYVRSVQLSLNHLIAYFKEAKLISSISPQEAERFKSFIKINAPKGYAVYIRTLKAAFNKAHEWQLIKISPFAGMRISKMQQFQPQYLKLSDLNKILEMTTSEEIKNIFVFAFYTGCRLGEILQIRWKNINLDRRIVIIGGENFTTKNKKVREIPIHPEILKIIKVKGSRNSNQLLFSKQSGYFYNRDYISRQFKLARRKAGLGEGIHFHSLRHSFASNLAISGVPIITIKELLGHSSIISTQIYSHSDLDSKRSAIEKL